MPGFPSGLGNCFRKQCESSKGAAFPLLRLFIIATCSALLCHLRKYLNVKLTQLGSEQITSWRALTVWFKIYLSWEGPSNTGIILVVSVRCGARWHGNEEEDALTGCRLTTLVTQTRHLYSWLGNWKEGRTTAPPLELKHPWHCANFYSCLQTRQAKQTATALVMFAQRNMNMLFLKRDDVFVPGVYNLIL